MDKPAVAKIMKLVEDGKISADEAMDLIEAMGVKQEKGAPFVEEKASNDDPVSAGRAEARETTEASEAPHSDSRDASQSPYSDFVGSMEKLGREISQNVNWNDVGIQLKRGAQQGLDFIKRTAEHVREGNFGHLFGETEKREVVLPLTIEGGAKVRVENLAGGVKVRGDAAENRVIARATFRGDDREKLKQQAAEFTLMIEESDGQVWIRQPDIAHVNVEIELELASSAPLEIHTAHGDIALHAVAASAKISCASGDIECTACQGSLDAQNSSGDVVLRQSQFDRINIESRSGNLSLHDTSGSLIVRTASGDVIAQRFAGRNVNIEATTGDVVMDVIEPIEGNFDVRTVSGNINIGVPDGSNARVSLSAVRGETLATVELTEMGRSTGKVTGRLGEGVGAITLSAVSGDVLLRLRDHSH